ncbi:MAG: transcriptional initiation protein Tat [Nitrospirae bacterium]|nr:transcriptional initiation protein Tat [Nitrospirota bacterium]
MKEKKGIDRRAFLKGLTLVGTISAVLGSSAKKVEAGTKREVPNQTLYRETEEFKKYYESLRY